MNLEIDPRYSTYSLSIILHLIHNNEDYKNEWIKKYPKTESFATNFFNNENCGCRPKLVSQYKKDRFHADVMTVNFINSNEDVIDFDKFCEENGGQDLTGHVFAIPASEGHYQDFLAAIQQKNATFSHFNTIQINEKILLTFF
jgi:hypothetical protein|tara:strand:- start:219 stop:647 length:429 start_codon:yes stop_codon:yes gene_type:complete